MIVKAVKWRLVRSICALALVISVVAPFPFVETVALAFSEVWIQAGRRLLPVWSSQDVTRTPRQRTYAERIKIHAGATRELILAAPIASAVIIDSDIATVEARVDRVLITGLVLGSTILIVSAKGKRTTYAIDVAPPLVVKRAITKEERQAEYPMSFSGFSSLYFVPGMNGGPSLVRHSFGYSQKLTNGRTLRMTSEMFKFFGGGDRALTLPLGAGFGANRLTMGLDSPGSKLDFLDSELEVSPLGFNGYTIRGLHFVSTADSRWRGLEIFAGNARPQMSLFSRGEGRLAGAIIPLLQSQTLRIRSGVFFISASSSTGRVNQNMTNQKGGLVLHTDVRYSPDSKTNVDGEIAYAKGALSWRGRLDLQRGPFKFYGETSHLDSRSPMIAIGAQSGGRSTSTFNLHWQPDARFSAAVGYERTKVKIALLDSGRIQLNSQSFLVSATYSPTSRTRLGFSYNQQTIDTPGSPLVPFLPNLQTRSAVVNYDQRISSRWTNNFEARLILSREAKTKASMNRGFTFREQLRYSWRGGSVTGFVNYRSNTPSLDSLILRNPALLPLEYRAAFLSDPQGFLLKNRDVLPQLLNGIQLPITRNQEGGIRMQSAFSRVEVAAEVVYSAGKFKSSLQGSLATSVNANLRLDAANTVQFSASRSFGFSGTPSQTSFTAGYTHRFGASGAGGFQITKLLGIGRGQIRGRVFMDLNSNGNEDPGEKGLAGMEVQIDGNKSSVTDSRGDFNFGSVEPGEFDVALISNQIGVTLRASNPTSQRVSLIPRQTVNLSFGLSNNSFIAGRIFNDLFLANEQVAGEAPGLQGVKVSLHPTATGVTSGAGVLTQIADGNGRYEFRNIAPGNYILEIDPATLPEDFRLPSRLTWSITSLPLQAFYLDLPFAAQRAVSGLVYIDRDGDGQFDSRSDVAVGGARVVAGNVTAVSTQQGSYLLRNLPAGKLTIRVFLPTGKEGERLHLQLGQEPSMRTGVNLRIRA